MPGRNVHTVAGGMTGGVFAFIRTPDCTPKRRLPETIGGVVGGYYGGRLPDLIEPATSPWHRGVAHSGVLTAILASSSDRLGQWERHCREQAAQHRAASLVPGADPISAVWHTLAEWFWRFLAGVAAGLFAGYLSHVALDALTPRSLPLFA